MCGRVGVDFGAPRKEWLRPIDELSVHHRSAFGGKAALLGEMTRLGVNVLPGVALAAEAYDLAVSTPAVREALDRYAEVPWPSRVEDEPRRRAALAQRDEAFRSIDLSQLAERILISLPESAAGLIVRSSATAEDSAGMSFAGQFLSVRAYRERDALADAIRRVWLSASEPNVRAYSSALRSTDTDIVSMGVVIQPFASFAIGGLLFTQHPGVRLRGWLLLEYLDAAPDLLVGGEVRPNRCRVRFADGKIIWEQRIAGSPELDPRHVQALLSSGQLMRDQLGSDVDMEWGVANDDAVVALQCRPATVDPWQQT